MFLKIVLILDYKNISGRYPKKYGYFWAVRIGGIVGREFFSLCALSDCLNFITILACITFMIKEKMVGIFLVSTGA